MFTYNENKALQRTRSYCYNVNIASLAVCYTKRALDDQHLGSLDNTVFVVKLSRV